MDRKINSRKRLGLIGALFVASALVVAGPKSILWPPTPIPVALVDGSYANSCCADIVLQNGLTSVDGKRVSFTLGRDNVGLFAIPADSISIARDQVILGGRQPYKLRFDNPNYPTSIDVTNFAEGRTYIFMRK